MPRRIETREVHLDVDSVATSFVNGYYDDLKLTRGLSSEQALRDYFKRWFSQFVHDLGGRVE